MGLIISTEGAGFPPRGDKGSFKLPFQEQIDFFNQKLALPSQYYDDILKSAHDRAFIVAGAAKADLLNDLHGAAGKIANEGKTIAWFRKEFDAIVKKHGWGYTGQGTEAGEAWRTRVIYQTNLSTSYAAGRWAQLNDPDLLKVRPYWKYIHNDAVAHPRPLHESWNGTVLRYDDPWWATHFAPNGWNCFTPDTLVAGDFEIGLKSFYSGKVFKFITKSGAYFTVTANHPILSEHGWVEAKTLKKGDNLLRYTGIVDTDTPIIINNQNPPAPAKKWFESLASDAFGICKIASFDFHSDTELRKGDVYVSGTECILMDNFKPLPLEQLEQGNFKWTDDGGIECKTTTNSASIGDVAIKKTIFFDNSFYRWSGISSFIDYLYRAKTFFIQSDNLFFKVIIPSIRRFPSRAALPNNSVLVKLYGLPFNCLSLAYCTSSCSRFTQRVGNNASANIVSSSNRFFTFTRAICRSNLAIIKPYFLGIAPRKRTLFNQFFKRKSFNSVAFTDFNQRYHGQVVIDDIVGIEESFYSGHVYTFQSKNEIIVANGIITHNCRCRIMAVQAKEFKGHPAPDDGTYQFTDPNGVTHTIPNGIDYGFDYAMGANTTQTLTTLINDKLINYPPAIAKALRTDLLKVAPPIKLSSALQLPTGSWGQDVAKTVLTAIDDVHRVAVLPKVQLKTEATRRYAASFNRDNLAITLSTFAPEPEFSALHEIGHLIDNEAIGEIGIQASKADPLLAEWRNAVTNSAATKALQDLRGIAANERLDYYLATHEQWARSYAQYIVKKSKNTVLMAQLLTKQANLDAVARYAQWQDDDFLPIMTAIDNLFMQLGWSNAN